MPTLPPDTITKIVTNPSTPSEVVDLLAKVKSKANRPSNWSKRSNSAYYKQAYGQWLKNHLDLMLEHKKDLYFSYVNYPALKPQSLYLRVNHALRYLVEQMDDEQRTYARLNHMLNISQESKGIRISLDKNLVNHGVVVDEPASLIEHKDNEEWRERIEQFVEKGKVGTKLSIGNVVLSDEQVRNLILEYSGCENILAIIKHDKIEMVKTA